MSELDLYGLTKKLDEAQEGLSDLRDLLYMAEDEDADAELDEEAAGAAVMALSAAFGAVKALAEAGAPIALPTAPLPLPDAALVTILSNAHHAERKMRADLEWAEKVLDRAK